MLKYHWLAAADKKKSKTQKRSESFLDFQNPPIARPSFSEIHCLRPQNAHVGDRETEIFEIFCHQHWLLHVLCILFTNLNRSLKRFISTISNALRLTTSPAELLMCSKKTKEEHTQIPNTLYRRNRTRNCTSAYLHTPI